MTTDELEKRILAVYCDSRLHHACCSRVDEAERENKALREQIGGPEREAFNEALIAFDPTQAGRHYLVGAKEMVERAAAAEARVEALEKALRGVEWAQRTTKLRDGGTIYTATTCPSCGGEKDPPPRRHKHRDDPAEVNGHLPGCILAAALAAGKP